MKVGIVGCGSISKKVHIPIFRKIKDIEIMAVADVNEKVAEACSKNFGIPYVYTSYNDMLKENEISLVSICAPNFLHKEMAIAAANAGKHILIEKPMALSIKECDEILDAVNRNNVKLCVVQNYKLFPAVQNARKIIMDHNIGKIVSIYSQAHIYPPSWWSSNVWFYENKYGLLYDIGSHLIDIVLYLSTSKVESVYAFGGNLEGDFDVIDHIQIILQFEDSSSAIIDLSWVTGINDIYVNIQGTGGVLKVDVRNSCIQELHGYWTPMDEIISTSKKVTGVGIKVLTGEYFYEAVSFHESIIKEFIENIKKDSSYHVSGEDGRRIVMVIEGSIKSMEKGIPISLKDL